MDYKEKVLAYFDEWARKGENPSNGCKIEIGESGSIPILSIIHKGVIRLVHNFGYYLLDSDAEIAARILKLEKPQAAPIKWEETKDWFWWSGEGYYIEKHDGKFHAYYRGSEIQFRLDTFEQAQAICQKHKQRRYDELGGR